MRTYTDPDKRYNTKYKVYNNGFVDVVYCNKNIFKYSKDKKILDLPPKKRIFKLKKVGEAPRKDNVKRAKDKIFDLAFCNEWDCFVTVTFDPKKVDSFNVKDVMKKLNKWLDNLVQRKGLRYVLVPEEHKSGRIHCHLLTNDVFKLVDSGKCDRQGHKIFNVSDWKYGWSTAIYTYGDKMQLSCYLTKYITKNSKVLFGRYYWSSRNLVREPKIYLDNTNFNGMDISFDFRTYAIQKAGLLFRYESFQST